MKENWNISGLILEGISGTGKTAIFDRLVRTTPFVEKNHLTSIILSEHHTQRILEKKDREQGLTIDDNISLLNNHVTYLESLSERLEMMDWCDKNMTDMRVPYIFERFHLTHVYQYDHLCWEDVEGIDKRLAALNGHLCLFTTNKDQLSERLFRKPDPSWHSYLRRFGNSRDEIVDHFLQQQDSLLEFSERSVLRKRIIDTSTADVEEIAKEILEFWDLN